MYNNAPLQNPPLLTNYPYRQLPQMSTMTQMPIMPQLPNNIDKMQNDQRTKKSNEIPNKPSISQTEINNDSIIPNGPIKADGIKGLGPESIQNICEITDKQNEGHEFVDKDEYCANLYYQSPAVYYSSKRIKEKVPQFTYPYKLYNYDDINKEFKRARSKDP